MSTVRPFILASDSPQRRRLLKSLLLPFRVVPANIPETSTERNPRRLVVELALSKAREVASRRPKALILGADTIVVCLGHILGKPKDRDDALRILSLLNGRWHRVYTGIALLDAESGRAWKEVTVSRVKARRLHAADLSRLSRKHLDKAGAYAIQDGKDPFIETIIGPLDNVIGLPMSSVKRLIRKAAKR